jgi:hypothetical protein
MARAYKKIGMKERILFDILLVFLVAYAPYWLYLSALVFGIIVFPIFWESIIFSLFVDFFYGSHSHSGSVFAFPFGIVSSALVIALTPLKERIRNIA